MCMWIWVGETDISHMINAHAALLRRVFTNDGNYMRYWGST